MKINGYGPTAGPGQARRSGKTEKSASGGAFAQQLSGNFEAAEEAHALDTPVPVGNIDTLLAVQAAGDSLEREQRQRFVRHAEDLLDKLEELRHGLLFGSIPKDKLIALARMVRSRRDTVSDPRLAAIMGEIELRAEVELAKLTPRTPTNP